MNNFFCAWFKKKKKRLTFPSDLGLCLMYVKLYLEEAF